MIYLPFMVIDLVIGLPFLLAMGIMFLPPVAGFPAVQDPGLCC